MFGTYQRLCVPVWASNIEVIRAARTKLRDPWDKSEKGKRKAFYRVMLEEHHKAQALCVRFKL